MYKNCQQAGKRRVLNPLNFAKTTFRRIRDQSRAIEDLQLQLGRSMAWQVSSKPTLRSLQEAEFKVFSQWGDDGIIQWLISKIPQIPETFVEFGVENYLESNTRFLLQNNNWSGLVLDGSPLNVQEIRQHHWFWKHDLTAQCQFIDAENINGLIDVWLKGRQLGILHIDIDGNDYWVWKAISCCKPAIVIVEYNALFGRERALTVPYDPRFVRGSNGRTLLYYGASLRAFCQLADEKGYQFVGCNSAGNNAYFVRSDIQSIGVPDADYCFDFTDSKFRETRDANGRLLCPAVDERSIPLAGLPIWDIEQHKEVRL
jgi:hypothetical protein